MSNVAADAAERRLRLRAEAVVALATAPPVEIAEAIEELNCAADAVAGAGLVPVEVTGGIVAETIDALYIRGVEWLEPTWPELDPAQLPSMFESAAPAVLEHVLVDAGEGAYSSCFEFWSDHAVVRRARPDGRPDDLRRLPVPQQVGQQLLGVGWSDGDDSEFDVSQAVATSELSGLEREIGPLGYFEHLVLRVLALATLDIDVDAINSLRSRLQVSAEALVLLDADLEAALSAFDAAVSASEHTRLTLDALSTESAPIETVPLGLRIDVGWLVALQRWSDHWCLAITTDEPGKSAFWAATCGEVRAAGIPVGPGLVRFDPALSPTCRTVTLDLVSEGRLRTYEMPW